MPCQTALILVNASMAGKLDAWMDFNNDGDFEDVTDTIFTNQTLVAGNNSLTFNVPCSDEEGILFARFRFSRAGGLSFNGLAMDGEAEDYQVMITNTQITIDDPMVLEGDQGTTNLVLTINHDNTTSANSVSFSYTTLDGTATVTGNDYQETSGETPCLKSTGRF